MNDGNKWKSFLFRHCDSDIDLWLTNQKNTTESLRYLIKQNIANNGGVVDVVKKAMNDSMNRGGEN